MASAATAPDIKVKFSAEDTGVQVAIRELVRQLQDLKAKQDDTARSARSLGDAESSAGRGMTEARGAAKLLSEEAGVTLNRHLTNVIANSQVLGPLLEAAFPVAAAIGFAEVIAAGAEKFSTWIADTFIFTQAMKDLQKAEGDANKEIVKMDAHIDELKKKFETIGLEGSAKDVVELRQLQDQIDKTQQAANALQDKMYFLRQEGQAGTPEYDKLAAELGVLQTKLKELNQESFNLGAQTMVDKAKEDQEAAKKAQEQLQALAKARISIISAELQEELSIAKAANASEQADNQQSYDRGLESYSQFFDAKRELLQLELAKELEITRQARDQAASELFKQAPSLKGMSSEQLDQISPEDATGQGLNTAQLRSLQKVQELDTKIAQQRIEASTKEKQLDDQEFKAREEHQNKILAFQEEILRASGDTYDATMIQIQGEAEQIRRSLVQAGLSPDQVATMMQQLQAAKTLAAQFDAERQQSSLAIGKLDIEKRDIELQVQAGMLDQVNAEKKLADVEAERLPELQRIADAQLAAARATGDPQKIQEAERFAEQVRQIGIEANYSQQQMVKFRTSAVQALGSDLANFLGSTINQVSGVGDAFARLGESVLSSLQQIAAQMLVTILMSKLLKSSIGGFLGFSGGGLVPSGGAPGMAGGGLVKGPGSATSDSIPARLSDGEYVVNADAVKAIGLPALEAINRGLRTPVLQPMQVQRFATGGLVASGGSSTMDLHLGIGLDPGLVLKALTSKAAGKIVLQHLSDNPKAAQKALQRAQ